MKITELEVPGVFLLEPKYFEDSRGYYCESYSKRTLDGLGLKADFVQDGHSLSREKASCAAYISSDSRTPRRN